MTIKDITFMKTKFFYLLLLMAAPLFMTSCSDDDDDDLGNVAEAVLKEFANRYPGIDAEWEKDNGMIKAEFWQDGTEVEVWFDQDGTWVRTETDFKGTLPAAVQGYVDHNYPGYVIDDIDLVETPTDYYYEIELDHASKPDITIKVREDGAGI